MELGYDGTNTVFYFPEYNIYIEEPLGNYEEKDGVYLRRFENGLVLVNPSSEEKSFILKSKYYKIIPIENGIVNKNGFWNGSLEYKEVKEKIELPPESGFVLKKNP